MRESSFKVSSKTSPAKLGAAILHRLREDDEVVVQAIGAGAVNQAVKAIAVAKDGEERLVAVPFFRDVEVGGRARTAIVFRLFRSDAKARAS